MIHGPLNSCRMERRNRLLSERSCEHIHGKISRKQWRRNTDSKFPRPVLVTEERVRVRHKRKNGCEKGSEEEFKRLFDETNQNVGTRYKPHAVGGTSSSRKLGREKRMTSEQRLVASTASALETTAPTAGATTKWDPPRQGRCPPGRRSTERGGQTGVLSVRRDVAALH